MIQINKLKQLAIDNIEGTYEDKKYRLNKFSYLFWSNFELNLKEYKIETIFKHSYEIEYDNETGICKPNTVLAVVVTHKDFIIRKGIYSGEYYGASLNDFITKEGINSGEYYGVSLDDLSLTHIVYSEVSGAFGNPKAGSAYSVKKIKTKQDYNKVPMGVINRYKKILKHLINQ